MNDENSEKKENSTALVEFFSHGDDLVEITTYIRTDQVFALELLENARRERRQANFDRDSLIQEALDLLIEKNIVAVRLDNKKQIKSKN